MRNLEPIQSGFDQHHFVVVGSSQVDGEWGSARIDDVDHLGPLAAFGLANSVSPFLARANQAFAAASDQSILPRSCISGRSSNRVLRRHPFGSTHRIAA